MRKLDLEQGSEQWLAWRKSLLTATDAATLLGISPYVTPYKGWLRKTGQAPEQAVNSAMLRGRDDEPIARDLFIKEYGINMTPCCIESETYNFIGASLDGISDCGKYILEVKSQRPVESVPELHMAQIQHQLLSSDHTVHKCFYVSHWNGVNTVFEVEPSLSWMEEYIPKAKQYWKGIVFFEPPALSAKDYKDMSGEEAWKLYAESYKSTCEAIKGLENIKETYRARLIELCGEESCIGEGVRVLKKAMKGRVDYKEACDKLNISEEQLNPYRKPSTMQWTIMLDQNKVDGP